LKFKIQLDWLAGFDKDAKLYKELSNFWFWFYRNGTLARGAEEGNPKKRLLG
jgi:dihydroorotate dehydrogenase